MTVRTLYPMFKPRSIAIIGRGDGDNNPAAMVEKNVLAAGFQGPVLPVQLLSQRGVAAYQDLVSLAQAPDLAIITLPLDEIPAVLNALGARGTRAALLISNENLIARPDGGKALQQAVLEAAKPRQIRILGPCQLGMAAPANALNATLSPIPIRAGRLSVVTQSSTVMRAFIGWGHSRAIGFSHLVSLGARFDVDCSAMLDYLTEDSQTHSILLYLEHIRDPRQFMSAARVAARSKPVIALKPRSVGGGPTEDAIYDAAFRRAGILRVATLEQLFNATKTLEMAQTVKKNRLLILGNSRSLGLLAADILTRKGGVLASLSASLQAHLAALAPPGCVVHNPIDLGDDAGFTEYDQVLERLLKESDADGVLIIHVPSAPDLDSECGRAIVERAARSQRLVMIAWVGATPSAPAWRLFQEARLPTYRTPVEAVNAFVQIADQQRNRALLMETPPSVPEEFTPATETARRLIAAALSTGRDQLNSDATRELLAAYQIPMVVTRFAATPQEAAQLAAQLGPRVALKILSPAITNRSDAGGVALSLEGAEEVLTAASMMLKRVQMLAPDAKIEGFAVQPMLARRGAYEVAIGVRTGEAFRAGPVLYFGHGGTEAQVINDIAYALPPLNMHLAHELMSRTRLYTLLRANPGRPANLDALALALIKVSQMVIDLAELVALDINPLWVSAEGVLALSARVRIARAASSASERLAIHPYPKDLEQTIQLRNGRAFLLRPILPEDGPALQAMVQRMPPEDIFLRFFTRLKALPHALTARLTQLDYDREMAFVLTEPGVPGRAPIWGLVSMSTDADRERAEYAIALDYNLKGQGAGYRLMQHIIDYARRRGIRELFAEVLQENEAMLRLNQALGFSIESNLDDPAVMQVSLVL